MKRLAFLFLLAVASLPAADLFTATLYTPDEVRAALQSAGIPAARLPNLGGTQYAQVSRGQLLTFNALVSHRLFKRFGTRWDSRFCCQSRAWHFVTEASLELASQKWTPSGSQEGVYERPAVIPVAYHVALNGGRGHEVLVVMTDAGPVWWDPAKGEIPTPSAAELATVFYPQG